MNAGEPVWTERDLFVLERIAERMCGSKAMAKICRVCFKIAKHLLSSVASANLTSKMSEKTISLSLANSAPSSLGGAPASLSIYSGFSLSRRRLGTILLAFLGYPYFLRFRWAAMSYFFITHLVLAHIKQFSEFAMTHGIVFFIPTLNCDDYLFILFLLLALQIQGPARQTERERRAPPDSWNRSY